MMTAYQDHRDQGFLPDALVNYRSALSYAPGEGLERSHAGDRAQSQIAAGAGVGEVRRNIRASRRAARPQAVARD